MLSAILMLKLSLEAKDSSSDTSSDSEFSDTADSIDSASDSEFSDSVDSVDSASEPSPDADSVDSILISELSCSGFVTSS